MKKFLNIFNRFKKMKGNILIVYSFKFKNFYIFEDIIFQNLRNKNNFEIIEKKQYEKK